MVGLLALRCSSYAFVPVVATCHTDLECGTNQICFPEGCADPGTGIVIEVTGTNSSGIYEQDQVVASGTLGPTQDVQINGGLTLVGELLQEKTAFVDPTNRVVFKDPVQVFATGTSDAIPGLSRTYQASFTQTANGVFSMPIGMGTYRVTAQATSGSVPPLTVSGVRTNAGKPATIEFAFPSVEGSVVVSGRLLKTKAAGTYVETPLEVAMDLQAVDPVSGVALSQHVPVPAGKGDFILSMSPAAHSLASILLVASPRDSSMSVSVPTKAFTLSTPLPALVTLEVGDFGVPQILEGQAVDASETPIANASVVVEGVVVGGGRFRSKVVTTNATGGFRVEVLPSAPSQPMVLTVAPPPMHRSGVTQGPVTIAKAAPEKAKIVCNDRMLVSGVLNRPDGSPAPGVKVHVTAQAASDRALPLDDVDVVTDMAGAYSAPLDTGSWRLEFVPGEDLPRFSRLVTVKLHNDTTGAPTQRLELGALNLPKGRRVTGSVMNVAGQEVQVMPSASIRFFRVTQVEGEATSVLLDSTIADAKGRYAVTLPTR